MIAWFIFAFLTLVIFMPGLFWAATWAAANWGGIYAVGIVGLGLFIFIVVWTFLMEYSSY